MLTKKIKAFVYSVGQTIMSKKIVLVVGMAAVIGIGGFVLYNSMTNSSQQAPAMTLAQFAKDFQDGSIIRCKGGTYAERLAKWDGGKFRWFPTVSTWQSYGSPAPSDTTVCDAAPWGVSMPLKDGVCVRCTTGAHDRQLAKVDGGKLRWFQDMPNYQANGSPPIVTDHPACDSETWGDVMPFPEQIVVKCKGAPYDNRLVRTENGKLRWISSPAVYSKLGSPTISYTTTTCSSLPWGADIT